MVRMQATTAGSPRATAPPGCVPVPRYSRRRPHEQHAQPGHYREHTSCRDRRLCLCRGPIPPSVIAIADCEVDRAGDHSGDRVAASTATLTDAEANRVRRTRTRRSSRPTRRPKETRGHRSVAPVFEKAAATSSKSTIRGNTTPNTATPVASVAMPTRTDRDVRLLRRARIAGSRRPRRPRPTGRRVPGGTSRVRPSMI